MPTGAPAVTRWQLATELVANVHQLEQRIAAVEARTKTAVAQTNSSLLELFGVGPVLTATFLGEVGDVRRFPSKHHFRGLRAWCLGTWVAELTGQDGCGPQVSGTASAPGPGSGRRWS